jgi:type II secretory pathway pseudopilin PulG
MTSERGLTIIELLVLVAIVAVLLSLGTVYLLRARASGNEAAAVASLRAISAGQFSYSVSCGHGTYATTLVTLNRPAPGSNVPFLPPDLLGGATVLKSGYYLTVGPAATSTPGQRGCNGGDTATSYYASARPATYPSGGSRAFAVTAGGQMWQVLAAAPPAEPFGPPSSPVQ